MSAYMDMAYVQALKAYDKKEVPVGAVVVLDGVVIGRGHNLKEVWQDITAHAEIVALKKAALYLKDWRLKGAVLYTTLEPCPMCLGAIMHARIEKVYYGALDLKWGACGTVTDFSQNEMFNHLIDAEYVPDDKCSQILTDFFKMRREENAANRLIPPKE